MIATDVADEDESLELSELAQEVSLVPQAVPWTSMCPTTTDSVSSAFSLQVSFILEVCENFESKFDLPYFKAVLLNGGELKVHSVRRVSRRGTTL